MTSTANRTLSQLLRAARQAQRAGDRPAARRWLLQATQQHPRSRAAWAALAEVETGARQAICRHWVRTLAAETPPLHRRARWAVLPATAGLLATLVVAQVLPLPAAGLGATHTAAAVAPAAPSDETVTLTAAGRQWLLRRSALLAAPAAPATLGAVSQLLGGVAPDAARIDAVVAQLARTLARPALDAQLVRTATGWGLSPERAGQIVDQAALRGALSAAASTRSPASFDIPLLPVAPQWSRAALAPLAAQLTALQRQPLWIAVGAQRWPVDRTGLVRRDFARAQLVVDPTAVAQFVARVAAATDRAAQPSALLREGERVRAITPAVVGQQLDQAAAVAQLGAAVWEPAGEQSLPVRAVAPPPGEAERLGLLAVLGRGELQFVTYSSPERDANVVAGGHDIDGLLIPPGAEFSFTQTVGDITWEKGYRMGEMIEGGQVVPSLGGGICQVSTTVFRAAFWSGLPITERHSHSWRLPWYEVGSPAGLDATIALGGPDLRFRNDTAGHLLISVATDLVNKRQTVTIYGTPTGRTVELNLHDSGALAVERLVHQGAATSQDLFTSSYSR